jgi:hypothetical protein
MVFSLSLPQAADIKAYGVVVLLPVPLDVELELAVPALLSYIVMALTDVLARDGPSGCGCFSTRLLATIAAMLAWTAQP